MYGYYLDKDNELQISEYEAEVVRSIQITFYYDSTANKLDFVGIMDNSR